MIAGGYARDIAKHDKKIQNAIQEAINSEQDAIDTYIKMKNYGAKYGNSINNDFLELLEQYRLEIQNKLQNKEKQVEALMTILNYLNALILDTKIKTNSEIKEVVNKISLLQKNISYLRNII